MVFSEMSWFAAALDDVPATYFVDVRVSERRQPLNRHGRGAALWHPWGSCHQLAPRIRVFLVELRTPDALIELCI